MEEAAGRIPSPSKSLNVGIVGGGIAGLYAGLLLQSNGHRVRVFEGTDRVGGRVYTHYFTQEEDQYFEAGAMRLPYSKSHKCTFDLIAWVQQFILPQDREVNLIRYIFSAPGNRSLINGHLSTGIKPLSITPKSVGWDTVPKEYEDKSAEELLKSAFDHLVEEFDLEKKFDEGFQRLVEKYDNFSLRFYLHSVMEWPTTVIDFVETVASLTDEFTLSVTEMVLQDMDHNTEDWYTIKYGMNRLPSTLSWLLGYQNITYGSRVTGIQNTNDKIKIIAVGNNGRIEATFDKVILAIPPAALKIMIADRPVWKVPKEVAIRSMHFEPLFKMGLRFKNRFWERVTPTPTAGGQSITDLPIRWVVYPSNGIITETARSNKEPGVLVIYTWMTDATTWFPLSAMERRSLALFCLARLYKDAKDPDTGEQVNVYDLLMSTVDAVWSVAASTGVAMFLPGQFAAYYEAACEPEGNIFFAGEHLSRHHSWITGACESAHKAVRDLLGDPSLPLLEPGYLPARTNFEGQVADLPRRPDPIFHPTGPPRKDELDRGAPLLLGSRDQDTTPDVEYRFTPNDPLFEFHDDGWAEHNQSAPTAFPLHLGGYPGCALGCDLTTLPGPAGVN